MRCKIEPPAGGRRRRRKPPSCKASSKVCVIEIDPKMGMARFYSHSTKNIRRVLLFNHSKKNNFHMVVWCGLLQPFSLSLPFFPSFFYSFSSILFFCFVSPLYLFIYFFRRIILYTFPSSPLFRTIGFVSS